jgi:3-oxoacyl-(acyl-carrier-protein) synthase
MTLALTRAGVPPAEVDVVFADAWGDRRWDELEVDAFRAVFGSRIPPVAVPKTLTGRLNAAGAALDLAWAAQALRHDVIPPAAPGLDAAVLAGDLDVVTAERRGFDLRVALVVSRGVGGFNAAAVLQRVEDP